ncbi:MAG: hypothetical protein ABGW74_01795 [Campylobacterales bacterium]
MKNTGEPTLENIEDYNELKGSKKKVVWAVVVTGLILGVIYTVAYDVDDNADAIKVEKNLVKSIPMK